MVIKMFQPLVRQPIPQFHDNFSSRQRLAALTQTLQTVIQEPAEEIQPDEFPAEQVTASLQVFCNSDHIYLIALVLFGPVSQPSLVQNKSLKQIISMDNCFHAQSLIYCEWVKIESLNNTLVISE